MSSSSNLYTISFHKAASFCKPKLLPGLNFNWSSRLIANKSSSVVCSVVSQDAYHVSVRTHPTARSNVVTLIDQTEEALFSTGKFGRFGGIFVPETLVNCLNMLVDEFNAVLRDPEFQAELAIALRDYVGRETPLYFAQRLTDHYKNNKGEGPEIYLKREDLNHGGAHKINNAIAQAMLAKRMGRKNVVAATGAGQHGVATAAACAKLGLNCTIVMGNVDMERQSSNVLLMKHLGAKIPANT